MEDKDSPEIEHDGQDADCRSAHPHLRPKSEDRRPKAEPCGRLVMTCGERLGDVEVFSQRQPLGEQDQYGRIHLVNIVNVNRISTESLRKLTVPITCDRTVIYSDILFAGSPVSTVTLCSQWMRL